MPSIKRAEGLADFIAEAGIAQPISNIASTSTATLRGSEPAPTAARAVCRCRRRLGRSVSEAPLTTSGMLREAGHGVDEARHLHATFDSVEIAAAGLAHLRDDVECAKAGGRLALLDLEFFADLADIFQAVRTQRHLAGDEDQIAADDEGHVVRHRRDRLWQGDVQVP